MKIVRFWAKGQARMGVVEDANVREVTGTLETFWRLTDNVYPLEGLKLLAPCEPRQIICVGFNYKAHAEELQEQVPPEPSIFSKAAHTVIGTGEPIIYPEQSQLVMYEAELAVVIKHKMRNISPEEAHKYILGYTCANDVTAKDLQDRERQWMRSKSFDTFCPLGPWLETELNPCDLAIKAYVNGELQQDERTSAMIYSPYEILSYISHSMTLDAGDLILTGTPVGNKEIKVGDEVVIEIEGIGQLKNSVKK